MKNQKIVEVENGNIVRVWDGMFDRSFGGSRNQAEAIMQIRAGGGTDWRGHIEKLEKLIIALRKRHDGADDDFICEFLPGEDGHWLNNLKSYYINSTVKFRTEAEKQRLINDILNNRG